MRDRKICASLILKAAAEVLFEVVADGTVELHAHDSHAAALPQQLFHLFAKISAFYAEGFIVHLNIRIAGNAEHGLFKYIVHFEHMVSVGEQNILSENIAQTVSPAGTQPAAAMRARAADRAVRSFCG